MSPTAAVGLILFLAGGSLGIIFLIARTTPQMPIPDQADLKPGSKERSERIGDTAIFAMAAISLFAAFIGLVLLVRAVS